MQVGKPKGCMGTHPAMRPAIKLLSDEFVERIVGEALDVLAKVGVLIEHDGVLSMLGDAGAKVDMANKRAYINDGLVWRCLKSAPSRVRLYDRDGNMAFELCGMEVYFTPGSAALNILDAKSGEIRRATSHDAIAFARLADALQNIDAQSTAVIPSDVPHDVADRYRLFIVLTNSSKPIVTGTFTIDGFAVMKEMLSVIRGSEEELRGKPLAIFDACPSPPLKWSKLTAQCLIDCATYGIPAELVSMPLLGISAPVTLSGALVQHTAECLSGVVIHQTASSGAPLIYGGSPGAFDMRHGTVSMSAIEVAMLTAAYAQIGRYFGLPTHGYLGLSDSKLVDAQAGAESAIGTLIGALAGVNMIAGAGMIEFENCQSPEKLILDNELCGMVRRLLNGIAQRSPLMAEDLYGDIKSAEHFLTSEHTLRWMRHELALPSRAIDRLTKEAWESSGRTDTMQRCMS
ncbi:MAG: trimethylamine methyltransferase family protein, partial [Armatimonadota bacterium]|nr:trimethylamine methyltransferase family protein [Armatimonadota bacterium]MDW8024447.1 trimethylamine methyltransferase family protein [Armatimonadota bacterium]